MTLGLYQHYKGGWYIGLIAWIWESTNDLPRARKVLYISLHNLVTLNFKEIFNVRLVQQFFDRVAIQKEPSYPYAISNDRYEFRFKRVVPPWQPS